MHIEENGRTESFGILNTEPGKLIIVLFYHLLRMIWSLQLELVCSGKDSGGDNGTRFLPVSYRHKTLRYFTASEWISIHISLPAIPINASSFVVGISPSPSLFFKCSRANDSVETALRLYSQEMALHSLNLGIDLYLRASSELFLAFDCKNPANSRWRSDSYRIRRMLLLARLTSPILNSARCIRCFVYLNGLAATSAAGRQHWQGLPPPNPLFWIPLCTHPSSVTSER